MRQIATMLTIAGSDSAGGAGIQADCAAARSVGVFPICAVSCVTSQGRQGLRMLQPVDEDLFADQLLAAFEDFRPKAVKIGILPSEKHIRILIGFLSRFQPKNVVLDPIMAPSAGGSEEMTCEMWRNPMLLKEIARYVTLFTPNLPEARKILESTGMTDAYHILKSPKIIIRKLHNNFRFGHILLKGGHGAEDELKDILSDPSGDISEVFRHNKIQTPNTHGTGCALSSLIAARLASGENINSACRQSIESLQGALLRNSDCNFYLLPDASGPAFF